MPLSRQEFAQVVSQTLNDIQTLVAQGQKEYASDTNTLSNFEDTAKEVDTTREKVWYTFFKKHLDGIKAHLRGYTSQREDVEGRILDAIVYLIILRSMVQEGKGNFQPKSANPVRNALASPSFGTDRPVVEVKREDRVVAEPVSTLRDG